MAIHMVTAVGGQDFQITLSRDDAGNYVAEAVRLPRGERSAGAAALHVRVVDHLRERAMRSLFDSLQEVTERQQEPSRDGPDAPAAA